ncbi:nitroreductase/quinone reductase family protein [Pseudonocardia lacus]|uniref:nitroreductase/quinone reductase family protein n=1 Tax=Pseudonocardia lacus TaxID=2835865 RepID=UPI001BDD2DB6|nr:nitroreductase/quinone reductase family protein [Pseudonocardia lacus]
MTPAWSGRAVNGLVDVLLRTQRGGALGRSLLLLTVTGRRTGRRYRLPVQYARDGDALWVLVGDHPAKTWWRNLTTAAPVELHLCGIRRPGWGRAVDGGVEPDLAEQGLRVWLRRFPAAARTMRATDEAGMHAVAKRLLLVRVDLAPDRSGAGAANRGRSEGGAR